MKHKIIAEWQPRNYPTSCPTFKKMLDTFKFLGYEDDSGRYWIETDGVLKGCSYFPHGTGYSSAEIQAKAVGDYYFFNTEEELQAWLIEEGHLI